ncbi:MAG: UDP-N-acetylglucosamine 2-epimerase (hydrolyzing) [Muribaculaceae bacterium]
MRKICFITGTRADYGIMVPLMRAVKESDDAQLQVIATNMHLSQEYGMTVNEIIADGFDVDARIDSLLSGDSPAATVKSMGLTQIGMADAFERLRPDLAVILGDRYEMLAAASAALIFRIPVAHLYGGETTEGAYDDCIRHAITKLSSLHFTSTELYARRIIQMGEEPDRVFHVGSLGAQSIREEKGLPLQELEKAIDFRLGEKYVVATFHPVTTQPGEEERQTSALLSSLNKIIAKGWRVLFTMPNSDTGGRTVATMIRQWAQSRPESVKAVASLGRLKYYSALRHAAAAVGNSSSGLIEAPSFGIPTLNIGDRQKGRAQGDSVINCGVTEEEITTGLERVLSDTFREQARHCGNPYEKPDTLQSILQPLLHYPIPHTKPPFRDIPG